MKQTDFSQSINSRLSVNSFSGVNKHLCQFLDVVCLINFDLKS